MVVACILQVTIVRVPVAGFIQFLAGSALAAVGILLLFVGIDGGVLPMGRFIGAELPRRGSMGLILAVGMALGFATTAAEPDVIVLAAQVEQVSTDGFSGQLLVYVISAGVGLFVALSLLRIIYGFSLARLVAVIYSIMLILSLIAPSNIVALAYDAGSVTTGVLTAPVVLAVALGFSSVFAGRSSVADSFGLLGLASVGPIIVILLLGMFL